MTKVITIIYLAFSEFMLFKQVYIFLM